MLQFHLHLLLIYSDWGGGAGMISGFFTGFLLVCACVSVSLEAISFISLEEFSV